MQHIVFSRFILGLSVLISCMIAATASAEGYAIQPGDVLAVSVWNEENMNQDILVRPDGGISYPLAGDLPAAGRTVDEVRADITERLDKYIPEALVTVQLRQIQGNSIYVIGKVNRPGVFVMNTSLDVMQALSLAGGTATFAELKNISILRREGGSQRAIPFNYAQVEDGERLEQNIILQPGDVVVVP